LTRDCAVRTSGTDRVEAHGLAGGPFGRFAQDALESVLESSASTSIASGNRHAGRRRARCLPRRDPARMLERTRMPASHITIGLQCGGSDGCCGITVDPAPGAACDRLVEHGGTVILSETPEICGTEHLLDGLACRGLHRARNGGRDAAGSRPRCSRWAGSTSAAGERGRVARRRRQAAGEADKARLALRGARNRGTDLPPPP